MKSFFFILLSIVFSLACECKTKNRAAGEEPLHANCLLKPEPGPCRMALKRYFYDEKEKKCKEFIYGGCKGVVPFETLADCKKGCRCED
jgi:hypothetical protein